MPWAASMSWTLYQTVKKVRITECEPKEKSKLCGHIFKRPCLLRCGSNFSVGRNFHQTLLLKQQLIACHINLMSETRVYLVQKTLQTL